MRVLHVSDCYAPRTGGIESQVRDLAAAQHRAGHDVHVLTATPGPGGERGGVAQDDAGVTVHRLGTRIPFDLPVNPAAPPRMADLMRRLRPDVVHVHAGVLSPFATDGADVARRVGAPLAITWHCMLDGTVPVLRALVRRSGWDRTPIALSAVSSAAAERVRQVFGREVAVVPNGVDLSLWRPGAEPPRSGPLRAVATMRLAPRKRAGALLALLEDAMTQLSPGSVAVDVMGDGPTRPLLERSIARRGLTDVVRLHGRVPRDELARRYEGAHVFLAPAELEAFGIAALEARACGLVVVGRSGTGLADVVASGRDGLLVDDDAAMARALVRLTRDRSGLATMQTVARSERPPFGWDRTLAAAAAEYDRARALSAAR